MSGKLIWYLAAVAGTGMMATLGAFVREVSPGSEFTIALGRFGIGLIGLLVLRAVLRKRRREQPVRITRALVGSGIFLPLFVVAYFKAVVSGTMANAAFLLYLGPLIASFLAAIWLGEGFNRTSGLLLGSALLGTLFITEFRLPQNSDQAESVIFGLLSGLFYGLFLLMNNPRLEGDTNSFAGISVQFLVASLVMLPFVGAAGVNLTGSDLLWIAGIGVIHGFAALTLVISALGHLKTIEYGTIAYGEPVMAALIGGVFYHEAISLLQLIGCLLVLIAGIARVFVSDSPAAASGIAPQPEPGPLPES
ncbi:MAG: DMT family transporter [Chloroflexi bacterium]|nr:DMT family transporter [Chloroflexota bacterium]